MRPTFSNFISGIQNLDIGDVTSYEVDGLSSCSEYYYRVRAENSCGITEYSDVKNRVDSLIDAIWSMDEQMMTKQTIYPLLDILKDYLPTDEQWQKIFEE